MDLNENLKEKFTSMYEKHMREDLTNVIIFILFRNYVNNKPDPDTYLKEFFKDWHKRVYNYFTDSEKMLNENLSNMDTMLLGNMEDKEEKDIREKIFKEALKNYTKEIETLIKLDDHQI